MRASKLGACETYLGVPLILDLKEEEDIIVHLDQLQSPPIFFNLTPSTRSRTIRKDEIAARSWI